MTDHRKTRIQGYHSLFLYQVLDALRAGTPVTEIARDYNCTRAWIYLALKEAGIDISDFVWYRHHRELSPGTLQVATFLASKALRIRTRANKPKMLTVLDEGRSPLGVAIHMVLRPRLTSRHASGRYYGVNVRRKGYVHVVPIPRGIFVVRKEALSTVQLSENETRCKNVVRINEMSNIEILDVLRENIR